MKAMKRLSVFLLAALVLVMTAVPAFAASYTPVEGGTVDVSQTLYLEKGDTPTPNLKYTYSINATPTVVEGDSNAVADNTKGGPSITATVDFTNKTAGGSGDNYSRSISGGNVTVDFTKVEFKAPGIYRYEITKTMESTNNLETPSNNSVGVSTHSAGEATTKFYVFVNVTNDTNDMDLKVAGYNVANSTQIDMQTGEITEKSNELKDYYPAKNVDLKLEKEVTGDKGNKEELFPFTIKIENASVDYTYKLTYEDKNDTTFNFSNETNYPKTLSVSGGSGEVTVYLQHGQTVKVADLPAGVKYTITETDTKDHTLKTIAVTGSDTDADTNTDEKTAIDNSLTDNAHVTYTNEKEGTTPTGIILQYGAPIAGILLVIIFMAFVLVGKKRRNQEA